MKEGYYLSLEFKVLCITFLGAHDQGLTVPKRFLIK